MKDYSKENLDVKHYRNGDPISYAKNRKEWENLRLDKQGAYCHIEDDPKKGILYNWYAVNDVRELAPNGWKRPTRAVLKEMKLGTGKTKIKMLNESDWFRDPIQYPEHQIKRNTGSAKWWSSSEEESNRSNSNPDGSNRYMAFYLDIKHKNGKAIKISHDTTYMSSGFSVRCVGEKYLADITLKRKQKLEQVQGMVVKKISEYLKKHGESSGVPAHILSNSESREHVISTGASILIEELIQRNTAFSDLYYSRKHPFKYPGEFVEAVAKNNLRFAFEKADSINKQSLEFLATMLSKIDAHNILKR